MTYAQSPLTPAQVDRLGVLVKEIGLVADAIGLVMRFGLDHQLSDERTAIDVLEHRMATLRYAMDYLSDVGLVAKINPRAL